MLLWGLRAMRAFLSLILKQPNLLILTSFPSRKALETASRNPSMAIFTSIWISPVASEIISTMSFFVTFAMIKLQKKLLFNDSGQSPHLALPTVPHGGRVSAAPQFCAPVFVRYKRQHFPGVGPRITSVQNDAVPSVTHEFRCLWNE